MAVSCGGFVQLMQASSQFGWRLGSEQRAACWSPPPYRSAVVSAAHVPAATFADATRGRVGWIPRPTLLPSPSRRRGPLWCPTASPFFQKRSPLVMRTERPSCANAVNRIRAAVAEPYEPFLQRFGDAACASLERLDGVVTRAESAVEAAREEVDWDSFTDDNAALSNTLCRYLGDVVSRVEDLRLSVTKNGELIKHVVALVGLYKEPVDQLELLLVAACGRAVDALVMCDAGATERKARLSDVSSFTDDLAGIVRAHHNFLRDQAAHLEAVYSKLHPVAAALPSFHRLPADHQRSPGSILVLVPDREAEVCIPRDDKVVQTLLHVSFVRNARVASVVVSSPGVGKSHLAWDVVDALGSLDDPRFARAAMLADVSGWETARDKLRGTRPCIITFNSGSLWGPLDQELMHTCLPRQPAAAYLPLYARVLWCLRCADGLSWIHFARLVIELLEDGSTTVNAIIRESRAALEERPTLVIVEELNKIKGVWPESAGESPAEVAFAVDYTAAAGGRPANIMPQIGVPSSTRPLPIATQSVLDVYRHEMCTWTGASTGLSVLFTAPYFGLIFDEVKSRLTEEQKLVINDMIGSLGETLDPRFLEDCQTRLSSLSSGRRGSPFFVLSAIDLGFMDMDELAKVYFQPLFESEWLLRSGLPFKRTFEVPSDVSGRAFARLSGGHPRSAGFLRRRLKLARSGPAWSSVVQPASAELTQDDRIKTLLDYLLIIPVTIVAALHHCTIRGSRPIVDGVLSPRRTTWEDLVSLNALTVSDADSAGVYTNPCMPPLIVLACLYRWDEVKRDFSNSRPVLEDHFLLDGILTAVAVVCGSRFSEGSSSSVWEYTALYADVALYRVRAAAKTWGAASSGLKLPHDYAAVTLLQLYPGTTKYYTKGEQPLLNKVLYNAVEAINVNENEAANELSTILQLPFADMVTTVFKCSHDQMSFDSIKFLAPAGSSGSSSKGALVAVVKSNKFTRLAEEYFNVEEHVRKSLRKIEHAFGDHLEGWRHRMVLVVESNLRSAKSPRDLLSAVESSNVIVITAQDHLNVYGRALSGFMADGPTLYSASLVRRSERPL